MQQEAQKIRNRQQVLADMAAIHRAKMDALEAEASDIQVVDTPEDEVFVGSDHPSRNSSSSRTSSRANTPRRMVSIQSPPPPRTQSAHPRPDGREINMSDLFSLLERQQEMANAQHAKTMDLVNNTLKSVARSNNSDRVPREILVLGFARLQDGVRKEPYFLLHFARTANSVQCHSSL